MQTDFSVELMYGFYYLDRRFHVVGPVLHNTSPQKARTHPYHAKVHGARPRDYTVTGRLYASRSHGRQDASHADIVRGPFAAYSEARNLSLSLRRKGLQGPWQAFRSL